MNGLLRLFHETGNANYVSMLVRVMEREQLKVWETLNYRLTLVDGVPIVERIR